MDTRALRGKKVFVVDDEAIILMSLEDMLQEIGCEVAASAVSLREAIEIAASVDADAAVLDVNLGGVTSADVAGVLTARGIPVVYATGYGASGAPSNCPAARILTKPYMLSDLARALADTLDV
jgi:CheY-like chemotaxis protein